MAGLLCALQAIVGPFAGLGADLAAAEPTGSLQALWLLRMLWFSCRVTPATLSPPSFPYIVIG